MDTDLPKTSNPAARAFEQAGITSLEQAGKVGAAALLALHGVGPKASAFSAKSWPRADWR